MKRIDRRKFLHNTGVATLGIASATILADARSVRATPANDKITLGFIGAGGRGTQLSGGFLDRDDCRISWVADVDVRKAETFSRRVADKKQTGDAPKAVQDFRKMLDDKALDAVIVATPDHWHAPAAIWACQAGKDVYVEKPPTYCMWEGRKMIEAARKYKRIMQVGTQTRSAPYAMAAKKYIEEGKLGKIHFCRVYNQKDWPNFPVLPDTNPPAGLDWNMFNGPAPKRPYNANLQTNWHHFWCYSGGDIINDAAHQLDMARWLLGVDYPKAVYCTGGRFDEQGAAETPDTQVAVYDFDGMRMTFDLTLYTPYMLKISPKIRNSDTEFPYWLQCATRVEIYGTKGLMIVGRHGGGWQVFIRPKLHEGVVKDQAKSRFPDPEHKENFLHCVRSRQTPNADIQEGHRSTLLSHLGNISYRLGGQKLIFDAKTETIVGNPEAMKFDRRAEYRKPWVIEDQV